MYKLIFAAFGHMSGRPVGVCLSITTDCFTTLVLNVLMAQKVFQDAAIYDIYLSYSCDILE